MLCSAQSLKSLQLKMLEKMIKLSNAKRDLDASPSMANDIRALVKITAELRQGLVIMDEVDLILHPLKSELNFPIGERHALDFSPERWTCAIHCLDALFFHDSGSMSVNFEQSALAHAILRELSVAIEDGYATRALQRSPHLILLSTDFYHMALKPIIAKWMLLWLGANQLSGLPDSHVLAYLTGSLEPLEGVAWEPWVEEAAARPCNGLPRPPALQRLHAFIEGTLDERSLKLLNLAAEWVKVFLPHCMSKIVRLDPGLDRVVHPGLLPRLGPLP